MPLNKVQNSIYLSNRVKKILWYAKGSIPEFSSIDPKDVHMEIDTTQPQFGMVSIKMKIDDDALKNKIIENSGKYKLEKPLDLDTLWMTCSMYYKYDDGSTFHRVCNLRNGYQFPVTRFVNDKTYKKMEDGVTFTIESALSEALGKINMHDVEKELKKFNENYK